MKLHYGSLSSSSRRVRITAKRLGLNLEEVSVDLRDPAHRAELTRLNPNSKVPVLVDGNFVLWESIAIMQYFCDRTPSQRLYPTDARDRAEVNRWLSWAQAHWAPPIGNLGWENVWKKFVTGEGPDADQVKRHETVLAQFAVVLDQHLAGCTWLAGGTLSLADIAVAPPLMMTKLARLPMRPYQHVHAWFSRMQELPEWKATEPPQLAQLEASFGVG
jgi:glutathione S-transferase